MPCNAIDRRESPWPHRWAWALGCATFPLVWWGGFVTATGSGMAFRDWLTSDGVFMPLYPWLSSAGDKFIEHGHRLLGMTAGLLTIALVASTWLTAARRPVRWFALALFAGILVQGALGGLRVVLDARVLALIHGCTGPLFFAMTAVMVAMTKESGQWAVGSGQGEVSRSFQDCPPALVRLAIVTAVLTYLQIVLGAIVRHAPLMTSDSASGMFQTAVYFHVLMALAVTVHVMLLTFKCLRANMCVPPACGLAALTLLQLALGASSWFVKYGMPSWATQFIGETGHFNRASDFSSAVVVTSHGAVGSLILAIAAAMAVNLVRGAGVRADSVAFSPATPKAREALA